MAKKDDGGKSAYQRRSERAAVKGYTGYWQERKYKETHLKKYAAIAYEDRRYKELGIEDWSHDDPDGTLGGVAWYEHERSFATFDDARKYGLYMAEHVSASRYVNRREAEWGQIKVLYNRQSGTWYLEMHVFIIGARKVSP